MDPRSGHAAQDSRQIASFLLPGINLQLFNYSTGWAAPNTPVWTCIHTHTHTHSTHTHTHTPHTLHTHHTHAHTHTHTTHTPHTHTLSLSLSLRILWIYILTYLFMYSSRNSSVTLLHHRGRNMVHVSHCQEWRSIPEHSMWNLLP